MHLSIHYSRAVFILLVVVALTALGITLAQRAVSANGQDDLVVTFTKWVDGYPNMSGTVGGDVGSGVFAGEIITRNPDIAKGRITKIEALYQIRGGARSFDSQVEGGANAFEALVDVWQDNQKRTAVINGFVMDGWLKGARVQGEYRVINCPQGTCFQGTLRVAREALD